MGQALKALAPLALGVAGSFIGPVGFARYGFAIGSLLGGILFQQKPPRLQSNLGDLSIPGVGYGATIKRHYGTIRVAGDVIDCRYINGGTVAAPIQLLKDTDGSGKKKVKTEKQVVTAAYMWGYGELDVDLLWWEDSAGVRIPYNRNGAPGKKGFDLTPEYDANGLLVAELSEGLCNYRGTFTQPPDATLASFHPGGVPRYGGISYSVLKNWRQYSNGTLSALVRSSIDQKYSIIQHRLNENGVPVSRTQIDIEDGPLVGSLSSHASGGGISVTANTSAAELVDTICTLALCDMAPIDGLLCDRGRQNPLYWVLLEDELGAREAEGNAVFEDSPEPLKIEQRDLRDLPSQLSIGFQDINLNYNNNAVTARRESAQHDNAVDLSFPIATTQSEMQTLADLLLDELWAAQFTGEVSLLPCRVTCAPGDVLVIPHNGTYVLLRIAEQHIGPDGETTCKGPLYDPGVYGQYRDVGNRVLPPPVVARMSAPSWAVFDMASLSDETSDGPYLMVAACTPPAESFTGAVLAPESPGTLDQTNITDRATMGTTITSYSFEPEETVAFSYSKTLRVHFDNGVLAASDEDSVRNLGANVLAMETPAGTLILQFVDVALVSEGVYDITGLLPGRAGTEFADSVPIGAKVVLLTDEDGEDVDGPVFFQFKTPLIGETVDFRVKAADEGGLDNGVGSVTLEGNTLRPPSPVRPRLVNRDSDKLVLAWDGRTRLEAGVSWSVTRQSDPDDYKVTLTDGVSTYSKTVRGATQITFTDSELTPVFGSIPVSIDGTIEQLCAAGLGHPANFEAL